MLRCTLALSLLVLPGCYTIKKTTTYDAGGAGSSYHPPTFDFDQP